MASQAPLKLGQDVDKAYEAIEGDFQEVKAISPRIQRRTALSCFGMYLLVSLLGLLVRKFEAPCFGGRLAAHALDGPGECVVQVLQELASDKGLERFRIEYEKLYRALKKSHGK